MRRQSHLLKRGRETIVRVHHRLFEIHRQEEWDSVNRYFESRAAEKGLDTTLADREAETTAFAELERPFGTFPSFSLLPIGEEFMKDRQRWPVGGLRDLDPAKSIVALVDPLDGTKLEAREIPTWCIALVFYQRTTGRILAAAVGQATGSVYYGAATAITAAELEDDSSGSDGSTSARAWRQIPKPEAPRKAGWFDLASPEPLDLSAKKDSDCKYVVAFVAPSPAAFLRASRFVQHAVASDPTLLGRVYNMGGNPMLAKVADGTIDAVVGFGDMDGPTNTRPQKPHDYVPGAWIACQAGATAIDIDTGRPLEFGYSLLHPDRPGKRYIVARSAALAARCLSAVQGAGLTGHA